MYIKSYIIKIDGKWAHFAEVFENTKKKLSLLEINDSYDYFIPPSPSPTFYFKIVRRDRFFCVYNAARCVRKMMKKL